MLCDYYGNAWIGLFIKTNKDITLVPKDASEKLCDNLGQSLKTEVIKTFIAGSNLIGLYTVMNSKGIVLPNIAEAEEVEALKKHGLNVYLSKEGLNAHGNNIVANDRIGFVSRNISTSERLNIEDALDIELTETSIAGYATVGSTCVATNKGFLVHYGSSESEFEGISAALKLSGEKGSVNMGVGFIAAGLVANENGYVAGSLTSGFELGRIHSALGFL